MLNQASQSINIFISYSHQDEEMKKRLDVHLATLRRQGKINPWSDRDGEVGKEWDETIKEKLASANIILLLISADFNASDYIWNIEIDKAMQRHDRQEAKVIPLFLKKCDFSDMPYARLQGLPRDKGGKLFISEYEDSEKENLYASIVTEIRKVVNELLENSNKVSLTLFKEQPTKPISNNREFYQNLIAQNQTKEAITQLLIQNPTDIRLLNLSAQWQDIENKLHIGVIRYEEASITHNRIRNALIQLLSELNVFKN